MTTKTYLSSSNTAHFICAVCNRQFTEDMSEYLNVPSMVELKVKCKCGYSWTTILERRQYFRKSVNFPGTYHYKLHGKEDTVGSITVVDISRKGLKLKLHDEGHGFKEGDWLEVTFSLDDDTKTLIKRVVNVKNIFENYLGVAFSDTKHEDADIDYYMLQNATDKKNC